MRQQHNYKDLNVSIDDIFERKRHNKKICVNSISNVLRLTQNYGWKWLEINILLVSMSGSEVKDGMTEDIYRSLA